MTESLGTRDFGAMFVTLEQMLLLVPGIRVRGHSIVITNGCFDLNLTSAHLDLLEFAKRQGDRLVVLVNSDASVRRLKGPDRPIIGERDRANSLCANRWVNYVVMFDDDTPTELIKQIRPDVLVKGQDAASAPVPGAEYAGRVAFAPMVEGVSTTKILEKLKCLK